MKNTLVLVMYLFFLSAFSWPAEQIGENGAYLLISNPILSGPAFSQSVVLVVRHSGQNAVGVIINKPTSTALINLLPNLPRADSHLEPVFFGGPVSARSFTYLVQTDQKPDSVLQISKNYWLGVNPKLLIELLGNKTQYERIRIFQGYAGWTTGQLESEIEHGLWYVVPAEPQYLFHPQPEYIWQELIDRIQGNWVRIESTYSPMLFKKQV